MPALLSALPPPRRRVALPLACGALLFLVVLTGCGFHLKRAARIPFDTLYVEAPHSVLGEELRRAIAMSGHTRLTDDPRQAQAILQLSGESGGRILGSTGAATKNNIAAAITPLSAFESNTAAGDLGGQSYVLNYNLVASATFRLTSPAGEVFLPETTIQQTRSMLNDEYKVLAKQREAEGILRELRQDLIQQILRQIAIIKIRRDKPASS